MDEQAAAAALHRLTSEDWDARCAATRFCFLCGLSVCDHCCANHRHWHHGQARPELVQTHHLEGGQDQDQDQDHEGINMLVQYAQAGLLGQPLHLKNSFCTICRLAHCNWSCLNHADHHHPAAGPGAVVTIVRVDGWVAVPAGQLPAAIVHNVQRLFQPDGTVLYPVRSRGAQAAHHAPPAIHLLGVGEHPCQRPECPEVIIGFEAFCSLGCRNHGG